MSKWTQPEFTNPAVPNADLFRAVYLTPDASTIKQTLAANDTSEVIQFTEVQIPSDHVELDLATGIFTLKKNEADIFAVSIEVLRELTGGVITWGFFAETSIDDGATWQPLEGSTRRRTFASQDTNLEKHFDFTSGIDSAVGLKFRLRHVTDDASKSVSIVSDPAGGGAPSSAGVIVTLYSKL